MQSFPFEDKTARDWHEMKLCDTIWEQGMRSLWGISFDYLEFRVLSIWYCISAGIVFLHLKFVCRSFDIQMNWWDNLEDFVVVQRLYANAERAVNNFVNRNDKGGRSPREGIFNAIIYLNFIFVLFNLRASEQKDAKRNSAYCSGLDWIKFLSLPKPRIYQVREFHCLHHCTY
jgi:hypothetical protein